MWQPCAPGRINKPTYYLFDGQSDRETSFSLVSHSVFCQGKSQTRLLRWTDANGRPYRHTDRQNEHTKE